jgi:DNA-binding IclR family transcriptional regulator
MKKTRKTATARKSSDSAGGDLAMTVRAVERAVDILQAFSPERASMSVLELQQRVGLSRPTLYRLLHTLAARGLIRAEGDPQRFTLGHGVMQLSHAWLKGLDTVATARPIVEGLRDRSGETAALFALRGDQRVCVLEAASRHELAITRGIGETTSITRGATGYAILAFLPEAASGPLLRNAPDRDRIDRALAEARRHGFARSQGEVILGAMAMAAPYYDHRGEVAGALGLYGPAARIKPDQVPALGATVLAAARDLSTLLGYPGQPAVPAGKPAAKRAG